jgi:hypothetical protein
MHPVEAGRRALGGRGQAGLDEAAPGRWGHFGGLHGLVLAPNIMCGLRTSRTGGEQSGRNSGTLRSDSVRLVPICSVFVVTGLCGNPVKMPVL